MRPTFISPHAPAGRPRKVELTADQAKALAALYLKTNRTKSEGSMEMAWVLFCESPAGADHAWTINAHRLVGTMPIAALEVMRRARNLVGAARGGSKKLLSQGPYVKGSMRTHWLEDRRLRAGEQYSADDLTRNIACWIPWPWGGCKCSDKFGVKLGRWQTLAVHDDASGCVIAVKSVFRFEQSYRGSDAASLIFQTESGIGMAGGFDGENQYASRWVVEGGVWQSEQMLAALQGRYLSAKGRPNQKLVERWFGAMQTRDSINRGDMGRIRGETLEANADYLACRRGERDPRPLFLEFDAAQESLMETIQWMNEREIKSRVYGSWIPQERWESDTAQYPLVCRDPSAGWVALPERRRLTVSRLGMLVCQGLGPLGVSMQLAFSAPWLWAHNGQQVDVYFDPLGQWPLEAVIVDPKTRKPLGTATCADAYGQSVDRDAAMAKAIRKSMMTELRLIVGTKRRITTTRGIDGIDTTSLRGDGAIDFPSRSIPGQGAGSGQGNGRPGADHEPRDARGGMEKPLAPRSLGRRAEAARIAASQAANW